jgi:methyl-accepting chemotaxis protein
VGDFILNSIANNSNLILDPDLDSYWLMDAVTGKVPSAESQLVSSVSIALRPGADAAQQAERRIDAAGYYRALLSSTSDLEGVNFATAFAQVGNFSKSPTLNALHAPLEATKVANNAAAARVRSSYLSNVGVLTADAKHALVDDALKALQNSGRLTQSVDPELMGMCALRAGAATSSRNLGVGIFFVVSLVLLYLFTGFYRSVQASVSSLQAATKRMISGTTESFRLAAQDELGDVANSYNQINTALVEARELKRKSDEENKILEGDVMQLLQVVSEASDGDFRIRAQVSSGTVGTVSDAFNQLMDSMGAVIGNVRKQVDRTKDGVVRIDDSAQSMLKGASDQAREVQSATTIVSEISTQSENVSKAAAEAADAAKRTESTAKEGNLAVQSAIEGMGLLRGNVQAGAKKVKTLGDRSMEITGIVATINRIAEQTNMLALNAAIEAARAGENGRGFSVVAEEIRKLAERAGAATQEIDRLVKGIQAETNDTVVAIEQQTSLVEQQSALVSQCGQSLVRIRQVSEETTSFVERISAAARSQVEGTSRVSDAVKQIQGVALTTQGSAKTTAAVAEDLKRLSDELTQGMQRYRIS